MGTIKDVIQTPIRIIENTSGNILHAMKNTEKSYVGFGEVYFSMVNFCAVKGWKKHSEMTLNLVVPVGKILFALFDPREDSETYGHIQEVELSIENYKRLTVPPNIWVAFKGLSMEANMLLNISNIPHDPLESSTLPLENNNLIPYSFY